MNSFVVNPKNIKELQFLSELFEKMKIDAKVISDEEKEDAGLAILMRNVDRTDIVAEEEIQYKLNKR